MSRRPSLLATALETTEITPPAAPVEKQDEHRPGFIENRMAGLAEMAKIVKLPVMRLKASECSIWEGNGREYSALNETRLASLINSIRVEHGNKVPIQVRPTPKGEKPYQVIAGARRHWAVSWLNANSYPDIELIAIVQSMTDEEAFRVSDLENRERSDISDLERARSYKMAIDAHYDGRAVRMAERLAISEPTLSRFLYLLELPEIVVAAFSASTDVTVGMGRSLKPLLADPAKKAKILTKAEELASQQSFQIAGGEAAISANAVLSSLIAAANATRRAGRPVAPVSLTASGKPWGKIVKDTSKDGLSLVIDAGPDVDVDEILDALRHVINSGRRRAAN